MWKKKREQRERERERENKKYILMPLCFAIEIG